MVQALEEKGRGKKHPSQPFSEKNSNMSLKNSINILLKLHSPVKD